MSVSDARVCPKCGEPAGAEPFCVACGANLWQQFVPPETPRRFLDKPERPGVPPDHAVFEPEPDRDYSGTPMANWGYRVGAFLVDVSLVIIVALGAGEIADAAGAGSEAVDTTTAIAWFGTWLLNSTVIVGLTRGQTLGKKLAGTRIIRGSGRPARYGTGFLRDFALRWLYFIPLVFLIDSLLPLGNKRQSLRDKIVSTRVLQEPEYRSRRWPLTATATFLVGGLIAVTAATGTWDGQTDYEPHDRDMFISGCTSEGGSESGCACAFDYISARVPYEDYARADRTENTDEWPANVRQAVADGFAECDAF